MNFLTIGRVVGPHGLDGTLKIISTSYFAKDRYSSIEKFYFSRQDENPLLLTVVSFNIQGDLHLVKFKEINSKEEALLYKGGVIQIDKEEATLPKGYYLFSDLIGLKVLDSHGTSYGIVNTVEEYPAQITLRVKKEDGKFFFVPFIDEFIEKVDLENKNVIVKIIAGMI